MIEARFQIHHNPTPRLSGEQLHPQSGASEPVPSIPGWKEERERGTVAFLASVSARNDALNCILPLGFLFLEPWVGTCFEC